MNWSIQVLPCNGTRDMKSSSVKTERGSTPEPSSSVAAVRTPPVFSKLSRRRSFDDVAREVRAFIESGKLAEGDRLPSERDLAAQMGVSRGTVREALRGLETGGLVELKSGITGGIFIRRPDSSALRETLGDLYRFGDLTAHHLTEARILMGCEVARLACIRCDEADLLALEENIVQAEAALDRGDVRAKVEGSIEFHRLLAKATRNPALMVMNNALADMMRDFVEVLGPKPNPFVLVAQKRLLVHLRARDADAAQREMRDYLQQTHSNYLAPRVRRDGKRSRTPSYGKS